MSMTENTGLAFFEAQKPLKKLLDNLSGEHGDYWLESLKKMLKKEETPPPPAEVLEAIHSKDKSKEKIDLVIDFLKSIPVVMDVKKEDSRPNWLLRVYVHSSIRSFFNLKESHLRFSGEFGILHDFSVCLKKNMQHRKDENKIFNDHRKEKYENIEEFCKALYELGILYENKIPELARK